MNRIEIRDKNNKPIGYCNDDGNYIQAFHYLKGFLGRFVKSSDITFDKNGKIYCRGDGTQSLVRDADRS